jgi:hypothetical protein
VHVKCKVIAASSQRAQPLVLQQVHVAALESQLAEFYSAAAVALTLGRCGGRAATPRSPQRRRPFGRVFGSTPDAQKHEEHRRLPP